MSHAAAIEIVVLGLPGLLQAIVDSGLAYREQKSFASDDGEVHAVDVVVTGEDGARVGVKVDAKTKKASFYAHDCRGTKGKALAGRIAQRYAYLKVTEELRRKGYTITEEKNEADGSVRLVAQRWS